MTNSWTHLPLYLAVVLTTQYTKARPVAVETGLGKEDIKSLVYHILESSKLSKGLIKDGDGSFNTDSPDKNKLSGTEKGAIVGGTIVAGIILGATVGQSDNAASSSRKSSKPGTTSGSSAFRSWRHTFNQRISIPDSVSVYSQRSFGNSPTTSQVEMLPTRSIPPPTIPQKAAEMLGVEGVHASTRSTTPVPSPRLPNPSSTKHFVAWNPLTQNPSQHDPSPDGPLLPTPEPSANEDQESSTNVRARARTSSNCTMSTLGRELLDDVMHPLPPVKFSPSSDKTAFPRPPPPISKTTKPPPVSMNNTKIQKRVPSRRYFVPLFKKNGQLPSPTSPDVGLAMKTDIQEEEETNTKKKAETVLRDSTRAGLFSLGENKI
ncbi:hypothetical protein ACLX1H_010746 [Fusarium chlamydosporum]